VIVAPIISRHDDSPDPLVCHRVVYFFVELIGMAPED
jgi:hypothetical protein